MTASTIRELFAKPVDRPIDGVIKADDERHLQIELDEYVVTREVSKGLGAFTDAYLHNPTANGVWISGFFGSGKSHLLKMLSLMLDGEKRIGEQSCRPAEILLPKVEDEIIRADLKKAVAIPARSLLFNIDQKFHGIGGNQEAPILEVFMKVLNELQGYYGNQGYVAQFEHDLNRRGQFESFKDTYQRVNGRSWENDRDALVTVTKRSFAKAYADQFGGSEDDAVKVIDDAKDSYRLSIEGFANRVKDYLDSQPPGFRLNFFVDEAGQFIIGQGQARSRLLNLQTVVESLATATDGRATVFITSQSDLEGILGEVKFEQADDLSKIQGRFKTKLTLASADVKEVIQRRLLAKTPDEPEQLIEIYEQEKDNFITLYRFGHGSIQLRGWVDCQSFCGLYPFHPYQLSLFQQAIQSLATHSIFEGRNMAVGERSMLSVFQEAAKAIKELPIGRLASFDQLYDGIRDVIRADKQQTMVTARNQVGQLELRILKVLFLLKWVPQFKSTERNIAILLINEPNIAIPAHEQAVKEALISLESQSYLQRSGVVYEFLTDKEKDVEQEIKRVEVGDSKVTEILHGVVFDDVLRSNKIRFADNGNDYPVAHKIDDELFKKGKNTDVVVNLVTPEHPKYGSEAILYSHNMGGTELMAILPSKDRLLDQIRSFLKTDLYIRQNSGGDDEALNAILTVRTRQNSARRKEITRLAEELLRTAALVVNGQRLSVGEGDPKTRFGKAYQELIRSAYPKLEMIHGVFNEDTVAKVVNEQDDLLQGSAIQLSEAEQEVLVDVERRQKLGERLSAEDLVRTFEARPYGWNKWATLTFVARLYRLGKLELREKELLSPNKVIKALTNSRRLDGVNVRKQEQFDASAVNALRRFHQELFGVQSSGTDARSTCKAFRMAMADEVQTLREMATQATSYPFLVDVQPWAADAEAMAKKEDSYLLNQLNTFKDKWRDAEENLLTPLKEFLNGKQKTVYDQVKAFKSRYGDEFTDLPANLVQPLHNLLKSNKPYVGDLIPQANKAMAELQPQLEQRLKDAQVKALQEISEQEERLKAMPEFQKLDRAQQDQVLATTAQAKDDVQAASQPGRALLRVHRYRSEEVPKQLQRMAALATPTGSGQQAKPIPVVVASSALKVNCPLSQITNGEELRQWLEAVRIAAQAELDQGHRISL